MTGECCSLNPRVRRSVGTATRSPLGISPATAWDRCSASDPMRQKEARKMATMFRAPSDGPWLIAHSESWSRNPSTTKRMASNARTTKRRRSSCAAAAGVGGPRRRATAGADGCRRSLGRRRRRARSRWPCERRAGRSRCSAVPASPAVAADGGPAEAGEDHADEAGSDEVRGAVIGLPGSATSPARRVRGRSSRRAAATASFGRRAAARGRRCRRAGTRRPRRRRDRSAHPTTVRDARRDRSTRARGERCRPRPARRRGLRLGAA